MANDDDGPGRNYSDAQTRGYTDRKIAESSTAAQLGVAGITTTGAVLRELIAVAKANPIVGVMLVAVLTDMLAQAKVIRSQTSTFIFTCLGTAFAVDVAAEVADIWSSLNPFHSGGSAAGNADLIKPVPTTIVENPPVAANASVPPGALGGGAAATAGQVAALIAAGA